MEFTNVPQGINDIPRDNLAKLAQLFPSAVKDGQLDVVALKEELGEFEEVGKEKYELTWAGKQEAKKTAQQDAVNKTLKFNPSKSKNADTTENIYIEGDNLAALNLLRQNYYGSIKMIYIDPPYNTGSDFVYNDDFSMSQAESNLAEGIVSETGERYSVNSKSSNKYHAKWLNMMYPRLKIAKDLLTDDGVIFISIDDNEVENLKKICNEIYGEQNFIAQAIVQKSTNGMGDKKGFAKNHEFVLCYQRSEKTQFKGLSPDETYKLSFDKEDEYGRYKMDGILMKKGAGSRRIDSPTLYFPLYYDINTGKVYLEKSEGLIERYPIKSDGSEGRWTWGKEKIKEENHRLYASPNGTIYIKDYLTSDRRMKIKTVLTDKRYITDRATNEIKAIFDGKPFDTPKPLTLIKHLVDMVCDKDDIILDFFSGSATTAHAVMSLNSEDCFNRKFIMAQLPEKCQESTEAFKLGFSNICEIGEERIRRAGDKIKEENPLGTADLDIGFKVFEVADTNIKWNVIATEEEQVDFSQLADSPDQIDFMPNTKDIDVVYEIMLRQKNVPLSEKVEVLSEIGSRTYLYADSYLICLETEITDEMIDALAAIEPTPIKYVFRDSAFRDNIDLKTNAFRRLKAMVEKNSGLTKKAYTVEFI